VDAPRIQAASAQVFRADNRAVITYRPRPAGVAEEPGTETPETAGADEVAPLAETGT
jgi:hypothetical protein